VAVEVEIPHQRHFDPHVVQALTDARHRPRGVFVIDRDPHQLGSGSGQVRHLNGGSYFIHRVSVGHGLDHDGSVTAHRDVTDFHRHTNASLISGNLFHHIDDKG